MGIGNRPRLDPVTALRRRAARLIWTEFLVQAAAPAAFLLLAYIAAALFGLANPWAFAAVLIAAAIALIAGLANRSPPARAAIDRRIEAASGLKHRPLATLDDEPEDDNPLAALLWTAHRQRILASLAGARIGPPAPAAAASDPWALRSLLAALLICGAIIAGPAIPDRLAGAFALPAWPFAGPTVSAWITPPGYANQPPEILQAGEAVTALPGAKLTIIAANVTRAPAISLAGARITSVALDDASHRADATLQTSGTLLIGPWWHRLAHWQISIVPPGAPVITVTGLDINNGNHLKLRWHITDPYGLQSLNARITPDGYPNALVQPIALPANTGDAAASIDLSTSPFHDLPTTLTLTAENTAGVAASTAWTAKLVLPGLALRDRTAQALDQLRQTLAVDPRNIRVVATNMQRLSRTPLSHITAAADLKLAVLTCAIWLQQTGPKPALDRMLALIQEIEAGPDYAPSQALAAANQALSAALQKGLSGQKLGDAILKQLLQAMHAALAAHLAALGPNAAAPDGAKTMDMSTLDKMAEKIAADEAAGRTDQAAQELRQLQNLMNQLASSKPMTAQQMAQVAAAQAAAQSISQITQGEAALLDRTNQGNLSPTDQASLQNQLNATRKDLAKSGMTVPGLNAADTAMSAAEEALALQNGGEAAGRETAAIQALQKAAAALAAAQRNSFGIGQGQPGTATNDQDGPNGGPDEQATPLNLGGASNPARAIQQQIIDQDTAPSVPAPTHTYYHRLLQDGAGQ
jgi:hypothetical protein